MLKKITRIIALIALITTFFPIPHAFAQDMDEWQLREYVNPDEIVTIAPDAPFNQAIRILTDYSQEFEDRIIIDRTGQTGPVNVNISNMYWKRALQLIARVNNLVIQEDDMALVLVRPEAEPELTEEEEALEARPDLPANLYSREVEISAIFFEGNRRTLRELGVDWSAVTSDGRVTINHVAAARVSDEIFTVNANLGNGLLQHVDVTALFNALESANQGEVLSSPRIKVLEGKEGRIQVGQDISIKQRDIAGNVIDQFIDTGTILRVTPLIITESGYDFIYLLIDAERSSGTPDPVSTIITKQEAQSELLLLPGETAVIAGLYETEKNTVRRGIPFLKDLPGWFFGLKYLFGYNSTEIIQNELVIVLKADIVPGLQERAAARFQTMPEMLQTGRRNIILDRELGREIADAHETGVVESPHQPVYRVAPPEPDVPVAAEQEPEVTEPEIAEPETTGSQEAVPQLVEPQADEPAETPADESEIMEEEPAVTADPVETEPETVEGASPYGLYDPIDDLHAGSYTLALYAVPDEDRAIEIYEKLVDENYKATKWESRVADGRELWRVGVGQFETITDAEDAAARLPQSYQRRHFIIRIQ